MKDLLTRSITGILYVFLLLSAVFLSSDAFNFLFLSFGLICIYEFKKLIKLSGYYIFVAFLLLWWLFVHLVQGDTAVFILLFATLAINVFLLVFLFTKKKPGTKNHHKFIISLFYIGAGSIFLTMIPYDHNGKPFAKFVIIGIFILVWINDSFAYLVGRSIGRTKLLESVSPNKTVEGFMGGLVFSLLAAYIIARYNGDLNTQQWMILALVIVIAGSLGDLIESKFKRMAGVKDSGAILPGHGGLLDRLDSLLFLAPFAYLTLQLFNHVS